MAEISVLSLKFIQSDPVFFDRAKMKLSGTGFEINGYLLPGGIPDKNFDPKSPNKS